MKTFKFARGDVVHLITLREPIARDLIGLDFSGPQMWGSMSELISRCSGLSREDVLSLSMSELLEMSHELSRAFAVKK